MLRLFDFKCPKCGDVKEQIVRDNDTVLCTCGAKKEKLMPRVNVNMGVGAYGYYDETLGMGVTTNKQRREECIRQGVTPKGDTPLPVREDRDLETL